jgi:triosephosphate isomerase
MGMTVRRKLVAGNWKMNGSQGLAGQMSDALQDFALQDRGVDLALFPPLTLLNVLNADHSRSFTLGAQDLSAHASGAYTGEVSAGLLLEAGADAVLVGHSERRQLHGENDALIEQKLLRALENGLQPYLCIGETRAEREAGRTFAVVERQLGLLRNPQIRSELRSMTIAYEPVWAIGTGLTASPAQAQEVHAHIRSILAGWDANIAGLMRLLYGGSVTPDTAAGLFQCPDIDGGLVGGASLKVDSLLAIAEAATKD